MSDASPAWEKLPHDPFGFFELTQPLDPESARDLKRKYLALIKRFKPERFPEEFRRIREAFDVVTALLDPKNTSSNRIPRFSQVQKPAKDRPPHVVDDSPLPRQPTEVTPESAGESIPDTMREVTPQSAPEIMPDSTPDFQPHASVDSTVDSNPKPEPEAIPETTAEPIPVIVAMPAMSKPVMERMLTCRWVLRQLETRSAESIIEELLNSPTKSVSTFVALAVLSDFISPRDETTFAARLIQGNAALYHTKMLEKLARAAFDENPTPDRQEQILRQASQGTCGDGYFLSLFQILRDLVHRTVTDQSRLVRAAGLWDCRPVRSVQLRFALDLVSIWMWRASRGDMEHLIGFLERYPSEIAAFGGADPELLRFVFENRHHFDPRADEYRFDLMYMIIRCVKGASDNVDGYVAEMMKRAAVDEQFCIRSFGRFPADDRGLWEIAKPFLERVSLRTGAFDSDEMNIETQVVLRRMLNEPRTAQTLIRERIIPAYDRAKAELPKLAAGILLTTLSVGSAVLAYFSSSPVDIKTVNGCLFGAISFILILAYATMNFESLSLLFSELAFVSWCRALRQYPVVREASDYQRGRDRFFDAVRGRQINLDELIDALRNHERARHDRLDLLADELEGDFALDFFALAQRFELASER